jgi:branched-subunit amino acid aminotransferase/4-amino-4-deoxychorismate lyase
VSRIDAGSPSLLWGVGLYETMLAVRGRVTLEREHFERMAAGARQLGIPEPEEEIWANAIHSALERDSVAAELAIRCTWLDSEPAGSRPSWTMVARAFEIPPVTLRRRGRGRVVLLPSSIQRAMPQLKSISHLASVVGLRRAEDAGADEGLFTSVEGRVLEGTATNIFGVDGDTLLTPPVEAGILPGIVRAWVIENAPRVGWSVKERLLGRDDLLGGSFVTGSLTCLAPVRSVDGEAAQTAGERFDQLARLFEAEVLAGR